MIKPLFIENNKVFIVDQTLLPVEYKKIEIKSHIDMADAIKRLAIRGAPAIGIAACFGLVLGIKEHINSTKDIFYAKLEKISELLVKTRPTAVNLSWALNRMKKKSKNIQHLPNIDIWNILWKEACNIHLEDIQMCEAIGKNGNTLIPQNANILTHCNTGGLATGGLGTALGVIITARQSGKHIHVYADETRPLLQGARLTAWELEQEKVPYHVCTDSTAGYLMATKKIDLIIVGADRIAANGDTANKIGTYSLAVLAKFHKIPFYIAAPTSTIDTKIKSGKEINIENRSENEIKFIDNIQITPKKSKAITPAFDITPHSLITNIITEENIFHLPYLF